MKRPIGTPVRTFSIYDNDGNFIDHTVKPIAIFNAVTGFCHSVVDIADAKEMLAYVHDHNLDATHIIAIKLFDDQGVVDEQDSLNQLIEIHRDGREQYLYTITDTYRGETTYLEEPGAIYHQPTREIVAFCEHAEKDIALHDHRILVEEPDLLNALHKHAENKPCRFGDDIAYVKLPKDQHTLDVLCHTRKMFSRETLPAKTITDTPDDPHGRTTPLVIRDKQGNVKGSVKDPAIVFDRNTGTVIHIGEAALIQIEFAVTQGKLEVAGKFDKANDLVYLKLPHDQRTLDKVHLVPGYANILFNKLHAENGKKE